MARLSREFVDSGGDSWPGWLGFRGSSWILVVIRGQESLSPNVLSLPEWLSGQTEDLLQETAHGFEPHS